MKAVVLPDEHRFFILVDAEQAVDGIDQSFRFSPCAVVLQFPDLQVSARIRTVDGRDEPEPTGSARHEVKKFELHQDGDKITITLS